MSTAELNTPSLDRGLLRFATAGSVDDGKSTLIGRLMFDTKTIFEDQLEAIEQSSRSRGHEQVNLALLTDGLKAEREQGITIDVAYRYFSTPRRKFIIADTPGHVQYTRNMVTGASTAQLTIILVDARKGIVEQTRRHSYIASLLRIPHIAVCVNKMDLVGYDAQVFHEIADAYRELAAGLGIREVTLIPISALHGDNVVAPSGQMPWYGGPSLLEHLETVDVGEDALAAPARFPVQYVIRPQSEAWPDYRGFAGQVAGGTFTPGQPVVVLPSGLRTTIRTVDLFGDSLPFAQGGQSVTLTLADDLDVSRGDMIVPVDTPPAVTRELDAMVCWLGEKPLQVGGKYAIRHTTRETRGIVNAVVHKVNIETLTPVAGDAAVGMNDIARITLKTMTPLFVDPYAENRATGSFLIIDEATHLTVGAGMIVQRS